MIDVYRFYEILWDRYGYPGWWPVYSKKSLEGFDSAGYRLYLPAYPLPQDEIDQIVISAVLTQNTAWTNVEKALSELSYKGCLTKEAVMQGPLSDLKMWIRSSGCYNQKAEKLKKICNYLSCVDRPDRKGLLSVWGIGPETADSILLYAYAEPLFIADAYARRVFSRLGLLPLRMEYQAAADVVHGCTPGDWEWYQNFHGLIVAFAKEFCKKKPLCSGCPARPYCSRAGL